MKYVELGANNTATIKVKGAWTLVQRVQVEEETASAYLQGTNTFIVDFKETTFIDSAAIQGLVLLRRKVGKEKFWVVNAHDEVYKALKGPKLTDWIKE